MIMSINRNIIMGMGMPAFIRRQGKAMPSKLVLGVDFAELELSVAANLAKQQESGMSKVSTVKQHKIDPYKRKKTSGDVFAVGYGEVSQVVLDTVLSVLKHNFVDDMLFIGNKVNHWEDAKQPAYLPIMDKLRRVGFSKIGNGHFSCVYTHKQLLNKIIKVSMKEDTAYEKWLDFCEANPMVGVPVVYWRGKWGIHTVVVLDKMESLCKDGRAINYDDVYIRDLFEEVVRERLMFIADCALTEREISTKASLANKAIELYDVACIAVKANGVSWDLNMGNIMKLDGKYVVTDPWCEA